jgi:hypothetical protein
MKIADLPTTPRAAYAALGGKLPRLLLTPDNDTVVRHLPCYSTHPETGQVPCIAQVFDRPAAASFIIAVAGCN